MTRPKLKSERGPPMSAMKTTSDAPLTRTRIGSGSGVLTGRANRPARPAGGARPRSLGLDPQVGLRVRPLGDLAREVLADPSVQVGRVVEAVRGGDVDVPVGVLVDEFAHPEVPDVRQVEPLDEAAYRVVHDLDAPLHPREPAAVTLRRRQQLEQHHQRLCSSCV